ncbi:hypothetical protein [Agromyces archimandritae]|uniref:Phage gp6-like head-tail connector protein n=1 Tax=Agromyces archimandritae TaxID=2781962 RepID=A0A975IN28_9MICO|nr:hypothetical protein [Agromyces archimandritae]QTX04115.1 hypothetical protein G127AT_12550 [Agromyces archimandritae]
MASAELVARLTVYVKAGATHVDAADEAFISECLSEAEALVAALVGTTEVPAAVLDRARIEVGSELYNRRAAPNGISQFAAADGSAIRVARDPMVAAYPILAPFLPVGFA